MRAIYPRLFGWRPAGQSVIRPTNNTGIEIVSINGASFGTYPLRIVVVPGSLGANLSTPGNGTPLASSSMNPPAEAFDQFDGSSVVNTYWMAMDNPSSDVSWVGWDFGSGQTQSVVKIRIVQGLGTNTAFTIYVEYSDDAITWTKVRDEAYPVNFGWGVWTELDLGTTTAHRYWRVRQHTAQGSGQAYWMVGALEMLGASTPATYTPAWDVVGPVTYDSWPPAGGGPITIDAGGAGTMTCIMTGQAPTQTVIDQVEIKSRAASRMSWRRMFGV